MLTWMLLGSALAGYGDPLDGHPVWGDRAIHFWTNAARVAPAHWVDDYAAGRCAPSDFRADERVPKPGLLWNHSLGRAARAHTDDMVDNDHFAHASSDGTAWDTRVRRFYPNGRIGENIAFGYTSSRQVVLGGWMCSAGHRSNIMDARFDELGASGRQRKYTQNFGGRNRPVRAVSSGLHLPETPTTEVTIAADTWVDPGSFIEAVAVLDGGVYPMELAAGTEGQGVYAVAIPTDGACHTWYVEVVAGDEAVRYPEHGSYGWGPCAWDDAATRWIATQIEPAQPDPDPDPEPDPDDPDDPNHPDDDFGSDLDLLACEGCQGSPAAPLGVFGLLVLAVARRRR